MTVNIHGAAIFSHVCNVSKLHSASMNIHVCIWKISIAYGNDHTQSEKNSPLLACYFILHTMTHSQSSYGLC